nr:metastasis-suppressor KiSS-1 [Odocoileus virginianus texanus]
MAHSPGAAVWSETPAELPELGDTGVKAGGCVPGDVTLGFIRAVIRAPVSASPGAQLASLQVPYCPSGAITRRPLRTQPRQGHFQDLHLLTRMNLLFSWQLMLLLCATSFMETLEKVVPMENPRTTGSQLGPATLRAPWEQSPRCASEDSQPAEWERGHTVRVACTVLGTLQPQGPGRVRPAASCSPGTGRVGMCCHLQVLHGTATPIQP